MSTRSRAGGGANDGEVHGKSNGSHAGSGIGNRDRLHSNTRRSALAGGMTMTRIRNRLQRATSLCVPKTLSALMRWQNRLSWPNDWAAMFIPCSRGLAIQVEEPT